MFTVDDSFTANGITRVVFVADEKFGDFVFMYDFMGNTAVLDRRYYAKVFSKVFSAMRQPDRHRVALELILDGWGWHLKADPWSKVDLDAAYAAFLEALKHPD